MGSRPRFVRREPESARDDPSDPTRDVWYEIERLSGVACPPESTLAWVALLTRAGFANDEIDSVLRELGFPDYEDAAELPRHWVSVRGKPEKSDGNYPTFSWRVLEGLRLNAGQRPEASPTRADPPSDEPALSDTSAAILSELWALGATADNPQTRAVIAERLRWEGQGKRAFKPLQYSGYVKSCPHGYYLTALGKQRAERLA